MKAAWNREGKMAIDIGAFEQPIPTLELLRKAI